MNARNILIRGTFGVALTWVGIGCAPRVPIGTHQSHHENLVGIANPFPSDRPTDRATVPGALALEPRSFVKTTTSALTLAPAPSAPASAPAGGTLVLYDDTGPYAWLGELYAIAVGNLASHFGPWQAKPVSTYAAGDLPAHQAAIYVGSTFDQPVPAAFLDDVATGARPVVWIYNNIWQLAARVPGFADRYGYAPWQFDTSTIAQVTYKGHALTRYSANGAGIMEHSPFDATKATVLASAVRADGTTLPWAVRSQNLTYVGEIPFVYMEANDRYLAFCDILFDVLAPTTAERHRALVRIEDVNPTTDPAAMQAIGDLLVGQGIPFSIALIPVYTDPNGTYSGGAATTVKLADSPDLVTVLQ
jgi:uncharacterized protein YdaL